MSIWGHRDSQPSDGEAHETEPPAEAQQEQTPAGPADQTGAEPPGGAELQAGVPDGEPAPAFWRAQGGAPVPSGRTPEDAPPLADQDAQGGAPAEEPARGGNGSPAGNGSPDGNGADPLLADDVVVLARQTAADEPAPAEQPAPAGETAAAASTGMISAQRWSEILTSFVDDPRGSVTMAADVVDSAIEELVNSVRARQRALASSWQGGDPDTEQLRTALRDYRTFWNQVQQTSPAGDGRA